MVLSCVVCKLFLVLSPRDFLCFLAFAIAKGTALLPSGSHLRPTLCCMSDVMNILRSSCNGQNLANEEGASVWAWSFWSLWRQGNNNHLEKWGGSELLITFRFLFVNSRKKFAYHKCSIHTRPVLFLLGNLRDEWSLQCSNAVSLNGRMLVLLNI